MLDPFGGRGTVARVAEDLGRSWISIDLSEKYTEMARRRLRQQGLLSRAATAPARPLRRIEQLEIGGAA